METKPVFRYHLHIIHGNESKFSNLAYLINARNGTQIWEYITLTPLHSHDCVLSPSLMAHDYSSPSFSPWLTSIPFWLLVEASLVKLILIRLGGRVIVRSINLEEWGIDLKLTLSFVVYFSLVPNHLSHNEKILAFTCLLEDCTHPSHTCALVELCQLYSPQTSSKFRGLK